MVNKGQKAEARAVWEYEDAQWYLRAGERKARRKAAKRARVRASRRAGKAASQEPKSRNPFAEAAVARKGGLMRDRRMRRPKDRLRRQMEAEFL